MDHLSPVGRTKWRILEAYNTGRYKQPQNVKKDHETMFYALGNETLTNILRFHR